MFADVHRYSDVLRCSPMSTYVNSEFSIQFDGKISFCWNLQLNFVEKIFNSVSRKNIFNAGAYSKGALRRQQKVRLSKISLLIGFLAHTVVVYMRQPDNNRKLLPPYWRPLNEVKYGWRSESVGGQHGGWGCDVWRARFFSDVVWQPAL